MKSVLETATRNELISRIQQLNAGSTPLWGKMNVYQMLRHGVLCEDMYISGKQYPRSFAGRIFGRIAIKNLLKDEQPIQRNAPTAERFKINEPAGDVEAEKQKWIQLLEQYAHFQNDHFVHWFFGKMSRDQVGQFAYKHTDHHLRQFGV